VAAARPPAERREPGLSLYRLARPLLFSLDPENAHELGLRAAGLAALFSPSVEPCEVQAMGLRFPNPVGLAAGLDKNAAHIDSLAALGFGFIEVGTVTPRPQPGNAAPRLFRVPEREALINRFGFNNVGLEAFIANVARARFGVRSGGILGINIGRNADTPAERAIDDYEIGLRAAYAHASYVTINISSPNTKGLRTLQQGDLVEQLLRRLSGVRNDLSEKSARRIPLVLKVAPDLSDAEIEAIADALLRHGIDGLIATNTSTSREGVEGLRHAGEAGGLSGAPIRTRATRVLAQFSRLLGNRVSLIGCGGILSREDTREKIAAGAKLVQLYTGLVYRGPRLVAQCVSAFRAR
jgi:dihydroorotate dehydrogenase